MPLPQELHATGHAHRFTGEGGEDEKPQSMPAEDAHTNKTFFGRSGKLKANRPQNLGGKGADMRNQSIRMVQKSRKRK